MFDSSELLFLQKSVELSFITESQKERLLAYQEELEPGYKATTLVIDAGLMVEEEVEKVVQALTLGISSNNSPAQKANSNTSEAVSAATLESLEELFDKDEELREKDGALQNLEPGKEAEALSEAYPPSSPQSQEASEMMNNDVPVAKQAFPLPQAQNNFQNQSGNEPSSSQASFEREQELSSFAQQSQESASTFESQHNEIESQEEPEHKLTPASSAHEIDALLYQETLEDNS